MIKTEYLRTNMIIEHFTFMEYIKGYTMENCEGRINNYNVHQNWENIYDHFTHKFELKQNFFPFISFVD